MSNNIMKKQKFGKAERYTFAQLKDYIDIPPMLEIQRNSFNDFITNGINEVLQEFSPIVDYSGKAKLYFLEPMLNGVTPKYDKKECKKRSATYSIPLNVKTRFVVEETGQAVEDVVFLGDIPYMTEDCCQSVPPLVEVEPGHFVACHRQNGEKKLVRGEVTVHVDD